MNNSLTRFINRFPIISFVMLAYCAFYVVFGIPTMIGAIRDNVLEEDNVIIMTVLFILFLPVAVRAALELLKGKGGGGGYSGYDSSYDGRD